MLHELKKSLLFQELPSIQEICSPLKQLGIKHFFLCRTYYSDNTHVNFSTDGHWTEYFFQGMYELKYEISEISDHLFLEDNKISLWEMNPQNRLWQEGKQLFQVGNGISILSENTDTFVEKCCFYSDDTKVELNNFYINNIDILLKFISYFKDRAHKLIKKFENNRITIPQKYLIAETKNAEKTADTDLFLSAIQPQRFHYNNCYVTQKEARCLSWLIKGKTAEEIGFILNISRRTVEKHFANIKSKLNCYSKADLIQFGIRSGIENLN
jgi:DNA-binding CsgD family transcriptional regulator